MIGTKNIIMNKTVGKILILSAVIAIVVSAILVFYPTIIAPPVDVPVTNLHRSSLEDNINGFSGEENTSFNDSIYNIVVDKLILYKGEGFMTDEEIDFQTKSLVQKYLPIFTKLSNAKFMASRWYESDHKAMLERIAHLRSLKVDYGIVRAVTGSYESDLKGIEQVISNYREAKKISKYSTFVSVEDANKKIQDAEKYRNMAPLSNCIDLTNKLAEVKSKIGNSHYAQVESEVNKMANYRNMTEEDFNSLMFSANDKIEEYDRNRSKYGLDAKIIRSIKEKAIKYSLDAKAFFSKKINIDTYGQWIGMNSPSSYYRAYKSNSNYGRHNSEATMYFTIKGYDTFEFYIRSNGESNYDYVMVGKDRKPTVDSNLANTKGNPSSGKNLSSYKLVTLNNLDKSSTYTIYVTYRKDSSDSIGDDRGYVLIPYENN